MPDNDTLPSDHQPVIRVLAMPADTNASGDIFGVWLMPRLILPGVSKPFGAPGVEL
jgi:acyl-CoA thioesterase YciA